MVLILLNIILNFQKLLIRVNKELKDESFFNKNQKEFSVYLINIFKSKEDNNLKKDFISLNIIDYNNYLIF